MTNPYSCFVTTNEEGATKELLADLIQQGVLAPSEIDPCCRSEVEELLIQRNVHQRLFEGVAKLNTSWLPVVHGGRIYRIVDVNDTPTQQRLKSKGWTQSGVYKHPNGFLYWAYSFAHKKPTRLAI